MIRLHNTLGGKIEEFATLEPNKVRMYNCGPTVYGTQHIGNLSMFVFTDILRRALEYKGYEVNQVINFTDFGHLSGDNQGNADQGEDRMTKGLRQEGLEISMENMHILAEKYAKKFLEDISKLNIDTEKITFPYASKYIPEQIKLIETLEEKGFAYKGSDGVYFDTSKFEGYGKLGNINLEALKSGARVATNEEKRNPTDFLLWKNDSKIGWESPWGMGFPGWHIECSAMILSILGEQIDIHTGGIEHIGIHHNNEIAQAEAATGKAPFSKFWLHRSHIQLDGTKISKSEGNVVYIDDIIEKGISPLAFRYFLLGSHYRTPANFTIEALEAAENAYKRLKVFMKLAKNKSEGEGKINEEYKKDFVEALENDLNTPEALAVIWKIAKNAGDDISYEDAYATLLDFDQVLGIKLLENEYEVKEIPEDIQTMLDERQKARESQDWAKSDEIRKEIEQKGYQVKDLPEGQQIEKA